MNDWELLLVHDGYSADSGMKKKVLIYALKMTVGGVEKALLGQLTQFPSEEYDVTILLQHRVGGYLDFLPKNVTVVEHEEWRDVCNLIQRPLLVNVIENLKHVKVSLATRLLWLFLMTKIQKSYKPLHDYVQKQLSDYPGEYDLAIDYAGPTSFTANFVAKHVKAKEKWTWIHFDIDRFVIDKRVMESVYSTYDKINIVSVEGKKHFDRQFPQFSPRTHVFYNIVDVASILAQADSLPNPYENINARTIICTVGRIAKEKGQLMTITTLKILIDSGYDIHWCYIGDGADLKKCEDLVKEYDILDHVTFIGLQTNPYPWMKHCNIYVQPSVHEGFCITLAEAKLFKRPIVTTDFTGAVEQLANYAPKHKIVSYSAEAIAEAIEQIITV